MDLNWTLSENLENIMDKCNEAEKCSNAEWNQHFGKELADFESAKEKTNISKLYEALKLVKRKRNTTFFPCNREMSYVELEVKIYNFFVILTKKITCYMSL